MKNYNEMADDVFRRRDEIVQKQKRTRKSIVTTLSCVCLAVLVGVGLWQSGIFTPEVQQTEDAIYPGIKDNYGPGEEPSVNENNVYQPTGTVTLDNGESLKLISSYEKASASACYALPKDGTHHYSIPLNAALEEYEDKVIYRVIVRVYDDGKMVQGKELQKIADMFYDWGYSSALEITDDNWNRAVLTMLVKEDALRKFKADDEHGYFFFLFDESDGAGKQNLPKPLIISSMEGLDTAGDYGMPVNGDYVISAALKAALEQYNNNELFRVVIRVGKDFFTITDTEYKEIKDNFYEWGYTEELEIETDKWGSSVISLLLTEEEIISFKADKEHSYYFFLYEEYNAMGYDWPIETIPKKYISEQACFEGVVIEKYKDSCLVMVTDNGNQRFMSSDKVVVKTDIEGCPDYAVGDYLKIEFDGMVAESYPMQILNVFSITSESESE